MLEQVLQHLNNWFLVPDGVHFGTFEIKGGSIALPFLSVGQYFRVMGSVFNDGLHQYPENGLIDETFDGTVWALAIPKSFILLSNEIEEWNTKYADKAHNPYSSESFGGYSYTKSTTAKDSATVIDWTTVFQKELEPYKKARETSFVQPSQPLKICGLHPPNPWR